MLSTRVGCSRLFLTILSLAALAILLGIYIEKGIAFSKDIHTHMNIARVAGNAEIMAEELGLVLEGMEKHNMTSGHAGLVKTKGNSMETIYANIKALQERAERISEHPESEDMALLNIKQSLEYSHVPTGFYWLLNQGLPVPILFLVFFIAPFVIWQKKN
jgi:hypothetical protein